jgi:putative sterol carrier protein
MSDVKATFEKIQASFQEGADLGDLSASYLFKLTGDDGGEWSISIEDGKGSVTDGAIEDPQCTVTMAAADFVGIVKGSANAQMLFMSGKLKVAGNMGLALKLQKVLGSAR